MAESSGGFDQWAVLEIMGHQRFAGRVTEQVIAGGAFLRVDVPAVEDRPEFCKLFGASAVFCITPCDETTARNIAAGMRERPLPLYASPAPRIGVSASDDFDGDDDTY